MTLLVARAAPAQQKTVRTTPKSGVVSGRVFAITQAGDIKPARMAKIYLLWKYHSKSEEMAEENRGKGGDFAQLTFLDELIKAKKALLKEAKRDPGNWSDLQWCNLELRAFDAAVTATLQWSLDRKRTDQVLVGSADEEGNFRMIGVRPGVYDVIARGRAGFNEAFWDTHDIESASQDDITVAAGMETAIRLASPAKSCLELSDGN